MSLPFGDGPCMHEALFDDRWLEGTGVTTLDFAKAMIDEGFHPMTVYFPLVVHGAMLIEPTETESKASLDQFIASLRAPASGQGRRGRALQGGAALAPRRRLDETQAARQPKLRWTAGARSGNRRRIRRSVRRIDFRVRAAGTRNTAREIVTRVGARRLQIGQQC